MEKEKKALAAYTYSHFCVDGICAYLLWKHFGLGDVPAFGMALLYHGLAFAFQPVAGWFCDRHLKFDAGIYGSLFVALSLALSVFSPWAAIISAGAGNSLFHLEGGYVSLLQEKRTMASGGIFVGGGGAGVAAGMIAGQWAGKEMWMWAVFIVLGLTSIAACFYGRPGKEKKEQRGVFGIVGKDGRMEILLLLLFLSVLIRGYAGLILILPWKQGPWGIGLATAALVAGKMTGGLIADKMGARKTAVFSLVLAAICLLQPSSLPLSLLGIYFMNAPMAVTLAALSDVLPDDTGLAFGIAPLALFVGYVLYLFVPVLDGWNGLLITVLLALSAWANYMVVERDHR